MNSDSVLRIVDHGAWNGGTVVDNAIYEDQDMIFKGGIPVTDETIQSRIGVKTRVAAPADERIGVLALRDLVGSTSVDLSRTKILIGATNVGEDKLDRGPQIRHSMEIARERFPDAIVFDLYAGCPGFNVSVELLFMLSLAGVLETGDISIIVGAENIHRAKAFKPGHTANIIFGDDSLATTLETTASMTPNGRYSCEESAVIPLGEDTVAGVAEAIQRLAVGRDLDGIILDNQLGDLILRIPALAARVQQRLVELDHQNEAESGVFAHFKSALQFYDEHVSSFAFDIMSLNEDPALVRRIARAYVESGKYKTVASVFVSKESTAQVAIHTGDGFGFVSPSSGIVDTSTRTHGCFGDFIHVFKDADVGELFGSMDGKGVFLYATRGASKHLSELMMANDLTMEDIDLLIEHQANFAMIPATIEQVLRGDGRDVGTEVARFVAEKMVTNIHTRGNCSVVCMQRLPYDLQRGALERDTIQGFVVNGNLDELRNAKTVLYDSVGAGMTRSSFLLRR
jgi:3-oxoacyl-[acyl-carrier-protein] synthase III